MFFKNIQICVVHYEPILYSRYTYLYTEFELVYRKAKLRVEILGNTSFQEKRLVAKYRFLRSVNLFLRPTFSHKKAQCMRAYIILVHNPKLPLVMTSLYLYNEPYAKNNTFTMV